MLFEDLTDGSISSLLFLVYSHGVAHGFRFGEGLGIWLFVVTHAVTFVIVGDFRI